MIRVNVEVIGALLPTELFRRTKYEYLFSHTAHCIDEECDDWECPDDEEDAYVKRCTVKHPIDECHCSHKAWLYMQPNMSIDTKETLLSLLPYTNPTIDMQKSDFDEDKVNIECLFGKYMCISPHNRMDKTLPDRLKEVKSEILRIFPKLNLPSSPDVYVRIWRTKVIINDDLVEELSESDKEKICAAEYHSSEDGEDGDDDDDDDGDDDGDPESDDGDDDPEGDGDDDGEAGDDDDDDDDDDDGEAGDDDC